MSHDLFSCMKMTTCSMSFKDPAKAEPARKLAEAITESKLKPISDDIPNKYELRSSITWDVLPIILKYPRPRVSLLHQKSTFILKLLHVQIHPWTDRSAGIGANLECSMSIRCSSLF